MEIDLKKQIEERLPQFFNYKNKFEYPKLEKIILNIGIGKLVTSNPQNQDKIVQEAVYVLSMVAGQTPKVVKTKKSVSSFKLKKGMPVSVVVTLRGKKMYDFLTRFLIYGLARYKDFKGIKKEHFDKEYNLNFGFKEISVFPEAISEKVHYNFGLGVNIVVKAKKKEDKLKFFEMLGFPLK
jgi:large subunit ribosomal protein L5